MVFLARPRRAAEAAAPPPPSVNLRGGFDAGFCVRGEARDNASRPAAAAPAAVQAARRAPAFASLSRALFQLAAAPAPTKCVARLAAPCCDSATLPARSRQRAERAAPDCRQARRGAGATLQRGQGPRRRALHVSRTGAFARRHTLRLSFSVHNEGADAFACRDACRRLGWRR